MSVMKEKTGKDGNHEGWESREGLKVISDSQSMPWAGRNVQRAVAVMEPYELSRFQCEAE